MNPENCKGRVAISRIRSSQITMAYRAKLAPRLIRVTEPIGRATKMLMSEQYVRLIKIPLTSVKPSSTANKMDLDVSPEEPNS